MAILGEHNGVNLDLGAGKFARASFLVDAGGDPLFDSQELKLAAGERHVGQFGIDTKFALVQKARPADTTAYVQYDCITDTTAAATASLWVFPVARKLGGSGTIIQAFLATDQTANVATYRLSFYRRAITAVVDNAEATHLYANILDYVGYIDFPALVKETTNSTDAKAEVSGALLNFSCSPNDVNLYGQLQVTLAAGFTPANTQKYTIGLLAEQN